MSRPGQILITTKRLLNEMYSESTKDFLDSIDRLLIELENKNDSNPQEIYMVESIYQLLEKLKIMETNLREYVKNDNKKMPGNKLSELLSNTKDDLYDI